MTISRGGKLVLAVFLVCALAGLAALVQPANAGSTGPTVATSKVAGTVSTRMVVNGFRAVGKKVVGQGTVVSTYRSTAGQTTVRRKHFRIAIRERVQQQTPLCRILFLELGEVDLTLAGLHATLRAADPTQPIRLRLRANREGGILGKLFCDLSQGGGTLGTQQKAQSAAKTLTTRLRSSTIMRVRATIYAPNETAGTSGGTNSLQGNGALAYAPQQTAECDVLHLVLGPLHLDLLGLVVDLNKIILDLKAIPGTLLGNIFCQLVTPPPAPARTD
jgi:hypothetical protein